MKKYTYIYTLVLCILNISSLAYAHGDHDHDDVPPRKKTAPIIQKPDNIETTQPALKIKIQSPTATATPNNNLNKTNPTSSTNPSIILNAKVVANPNNIRYVFSLFDGLLNIQKPIIAGQILKKGQFLGRITSILSPIDASNQANQMAILRGEISQQQAKLKRYQLVPELIAKKDIDETNLSIKNAQVQLKTMQANTHRTQNLFAPISGIVTQSNLNANKVVDNKTELLQISPNNINNFEIQAEYYLSDINFNPSQQSQAFLLNSGQKIPLIYLGYIPFISASNNKNSVILRFNLAKVNKDNSENLNLLLGQSLNIEFQANTINTNSNFNNSDKAEVKNVK